MSREVQELSDDLKTRLSQYVDMFNAEDDELYPQLITNDKAYDYLAEQAPLIDVPDKTIEKTYYYRLWTLRKHWKNTPDGHILTEFHPDVNWAGPYNSINAAAGHHLREARWLKDPENWVREYLSFWLDRKGESLSYNTWYATAAEDYFKLHPDRRYEEACLDKLISLYEERAKRNAHSCGLYWSDDDRDAMELSISGSGIRPTLNSYMYGDACAIARMAARQGKTKLSAEYAVKAEFIRKRMNELLWDRDFYKVIPCKQDESFLSEERPGVSPEHNVREELGYIPWYFHMPDSDKSVAFAQLMSEDGFRAPCGITTAERRHPRFMFRHEHECLWNGPVWPFATTQTLVALANHLRDHGEAFITKQDYYTLLVQYAASHHIVDDHGEKKMWIDEDMDPFTGDWIARTELKADNWNPRRGGYERGKDYNHSCFCDIVLSGLLGIDIKDGKLTVDPIIPENWNYFCVTNLTANNYSVIFDRTGERYGIGAGIHILG